MNNLQEQIDFIVSQVLLEIRSNFKWNEFKKLRNQEARMEYLEKTGTQELGRGSSRAVFLLSNRYVLKMAVPDNLETGKAQNREEVNLATDPDVKPVVTPIFDAAKDYSWVVSEVVREMKSPKEFKELTGLDFYQMNSLLSRFFDEGHQGLEEELEYLQKELKLVTKRIEALEEHLAQMDPDDPQKRYYQNDLKYELTQLGYVQEKIDKYKMLDHPMVEALIELIQNKNAMSADMKKIEHWGKTASGKVVLLDYGYSREVARQHYNISWV